MFNGRLRRAPGAALLLAAAVGAALLPAGCAVGSAVVRRDAPPARPIPQGHIRVLTYNMLHGWPRFRYLEARAELLAAALRELSADVVVLQEVPVLFKGGRHLGVWLAGRLGFSLAYVRANGRACLIGFEEGEAVLSRWPILEAEAHPLPRAGPFERRMVLRVVVQTELGRLAVYGLHLSHRPERTSLRLRQARDLLRYVQERRAPGELPALVAGDFNATPDSQVYRLLTEAGLVDVALAVEPPLAAPTAGIEDLRDASQRPRERIDYLFLYPAGASLALAVRSVGMFLDRPLSAWGGPLWVSDHVGVSAELVATPPEPASQGRPVAGAAP